MHDPGSVFVMINFRAILHILGYIIAMVAAFMTLGLPFSLYYGEDDIGSILTAAGITLGIGLLFIFGTGIRRGIEKELGKRDGYVIVILSWLVCAGFGALPFLIHGENLPTITDAFFETMSGFTTTGASVLNNIEAMPKGLLFWRSMTHWLGGMGIIVLSLAIMPLLGFGGSRLFEAEMPGPTKDKIHPHVRGTALRLWLIYTIFTVLETILLMFGGLSFFDALCHAFGTMATGGFSTRNASVAAFNSAYIEYVIIIFMFVAGCNFSLHYHALHGRIHAYYNDEEFRFYGVFTLLVVLGVGAMIYWASGMGLGAEKSFRDSAFQVVSIITSTGFITADYESWTKYSQGIFFFLLFFGACAGSTTGGVKMIRILLLGKNSLLELRRIIHPRAIVPVRFNGKMVPQGVINNILAFFVLYAIIFAVGVLLLNITGLDFRSSMGAVVATLSCMGPGIGQVGPLGNFHDISVFGKWVLSFLMLMGRLEIFTVLIIFSPGFWKV